MASIRFKHALLPALLALAASCGKEAHSPPPAQPAGEHSSTTVAAAGAKTGAPATADWCGAHGVPESVCTRCNPKLIPAFEAKGDWCKDHGLPESQCTICHPDLIEKFRKMAPAAGASAHAPAPDTAAATAVADWCGGHGVPESICTRCNASLIPGFKAKGDWCAEHGLPESQCTICNPELIEKFKKSAPGAAAAAPAPAPAVAATDWCGAHGVPESICTRCNASLIPGFKAKGDWCAEHGLPESQCTICHPDLIKKFKKMAPNTPQSGSKEEPARPYEGVKVRLASPETASKAGIRTESVREAPVELTVDAPVRLGFDATRSARVASPVTGIVREVRVVPGARVKAGAPVVVVASPELSEATAKLRDAEASLTLARQTAEREQQLVARKISARKDLLEAERQLQAAEASLASARGVLGSLGAGQGAIDGTGQLVLRASRAGVALRVDAAVGQSVSPGMALVEIQDPTRLWAELQLPERDVSRVHEGDAISLAFENLPGRNVTGTITWVSPEIDPTTRTVLARAEVLNPDGMLRSGLFGRAQVRLGSHRGVVVSGEAVQDAPEGPVAFVQLDPQIYEPRSLRLGRAAGGDVEVLAGLRSGERVVTHGSFLLKTEIMKGSLGAGCCDAVEK